MTDLTGQQEELNIEGVGTCHAHKVKALLSLFKERVLSPLYTFSHLAMTSTFLNPNTRTCSHWRP